MIQQINKLTSFYILYIFLAVGFLQPSQIVLGEESTGTGAVLDLSRNTQFPIKMQLQGDGSLKMDIQGLSPIIAPPNTFVELLTTQTQKGEVDRKIRVSGYKGEFHYEEIIPIPSQLPPPPSSAPSNPASATNPNHQVSLSPLTPSKPRLEGITLTENMLNLHRDPFISKPSSWQPNLTVTAQTAFGLIGSNIYNQAVQERIRRRGYDPLIKEIHQRINEARAKIDATQEKNPNQIREENFQYLQQVLSAAQSSKWLALSRFDPPTPMPAGMSESELDKLRGQLDGVWEAKYYHASWVKTAEAIDRVESRIGALREIGQTEKANYLQQELSREYVNYDGVLKGLTYAKAPNEYLITDRYSNEGRQIRSSLNRLLGSEESLGIACASLVGSLESFRTPCREIGTALGELKDSHLFLDHLAFNGEENTFNALMGGLQKSVNQISSFVSGFGKGLVTSTVSSVEGLIQTAHFLVTQPREFISAVSTFIENTSLEKIRSFVETEFEEILTADAETLGKKMGGLASDIALGIGTGSLAKAPTILVKAVTRVSTKESVAVLARKAVLTGRLPQEFAARVTELAKKAPFATRTLLSNEKKLLLEGSDIVKQASKDSRFLQVLEAADHPDLNIKKIEDLNQAYSLAPDPLSQIALAKPQELEKYTKIINESKGIKLSHPSGKTVSQEMSLEALKARADILGGKNIVYRIGNYGETRTTLPRIDSLETPRTWALENPITTPDFSDKYGIYSRGKDFVEIGEVRHDGMFVTQKAGPGKIRLPDGKRIVTKGGGIEVVVKPDTVDNIRHYGQ